MILLVDDDDDYRHACCEVLTLSGCPTVGASDGREALAILRRSDGVRLILLDLTMPGMNGWELHAHLRADPKLAAIPVVVLTAGEGRLDGVEHLSKLVGLPELLEVVQRYCR
jgi:CheY-like chemotaxis protein